MNNPQFEQIKGDDEISERVVDDSDEKKGNNEIIEEVPEETEKSITE